MCRNIRPLFNFEPAAGDEEIRDAALQFVRKVSGFNKPSRANEDAFERAVDHIAATVRELIGTLRSTTPPRDRGAHAARAKARSARRFAGRGA